MPVERRNGQIVWPPLAVEGRPIDRPEEAGRGRRQLEADEAGTVGLATSFFRVALVVIAASVVTSAGIAIWAAQVEQNFDANSTFPAPTVAPATEPAAMPADNARETRAAYIGTTAAQLRETDHRGCL